jgi:hypothetical protein
MMSLPSCERVEIGIPVGARLLAMDGDTTGRISGPVMALVAMSGLDLLALEKGALIL